MRKKDFSHVTTFSFLDTLESALIRSALFLVLTFYISVCI